ncbi:MAG: rhodanese-like domain-containing protein [Bacteroidales bacterium]
MIHLKYSLLLFLILVSSCIRTPDEEVYFLSEIYYSELRDLLVDLDESVRDEYWINFIDVGDREDYGDGYIRYAENLEMKFILDTAGVLINNGRAVKERFDEQRTCIVYSSTHDTVAYLAAQILQFLGYTKIYFYEGGITDWLAHGDYLNMTYHGFKSWHSGSFPFEDTLVALVDIHPDPWYRGLEVLEGHIPGAINIPADSLIKMENGTFSLVDEGKFLTENIPDRSARIVVYDSEGASDKSAGFLEAAGFLEYERVYLFQSGYNEWIANGNPVVTE